MTTLIARPFLGATLALAISCAAVKGHAVIFGDLHITGSARLNATDIDWVALGGGNGSFVVQPTSTGSFAPLGLTGGLIRDLNIVFQPPGIPFSFANYIILIPEPTFQIRLSFIALGTVNPPSFGSWYNMIEHSGNTTLFVDMMGSAIDSGTVGSSWLGTWSFDFAGRSMSQVISEMNAAGFVDAPFSAALRFTTVPEPATGAVLGLAVAGIFARSRQRRR